MTAFAAYTVIGLGLGGIFSLAALGIVLIYRTTGVLNFAHGAMGMFSTFVAWQVFYGWSHPFWPTWLATLLAVIAGLLFAAVMGLVLELAVFRWVRTREPVVKAVITIGVLLALQSAASLIWKNNQYHLPIYVVPQTWVWVMPGADVPVGANSILIIAVAVGLAFGLGAFLRYTSFGRAMRAVSDSPTSASLWGVPVNKVRAVSWMLGSLVAALAGILITPFINFDTTSLTLLIIDALAAALIGGLVSRPLTVLGGFVLGLLETYPTIWIQSLGFPRLVALLVILFVLIVRNPRAFAVAAK
ncbi:MAG TPA: branched-chain amino acid ABC transporter permease, partial [Candidatus Dormibacteraeota bacterium]|nr:branched-chain amino acid ABC transporter permease [Candidatus Dormibacteraeota bacterium]